ncbi:MAG TPA: hypothetical protein VLH94_01035 [Spirochaetia bacterium]|nr:hypothetical protein [Spirochaetia bacterium]
MPKKRSPPRALLEAGTFNYFTDEGVAHDRAAVPVSISATLPVVSVLHPYFSLFS